MNLPSEARTKLNGLRIRADQFQVLATSHRNQIADLERLLSNADEDDTVERIERRIDELKGNLQVSQKSHREASALVVNIERHLKSLPANGLLELVAPNDLRDRTIDELVRCVRDTRAAITETKAEISRVTHAPQPRDEIKKQVRRRVEELAERGKPRVMTAGDQVSFEFVDPNSFGPSSARMVSIMAWLFPDQMVARLSEQFDSAPEPTLALTADQRKKRLTKLRDKLDGLERLEEDCIELAAMRDQFIERRSDASPMAVLGIRVRDRAERVRLAG